MIPKPSETDLSTLSGLLDDAESIARIEWLRSLSKKEQAALFLMAEGTQMRPEEVLGEDGHILIHHGKNSLPVYSNFQKRITKHQGVIQGYNHQSLQWLVGPGHFRVIENEAVPGELLFDYLWAPESVPEGFPAARSNKGGFSGLVYGNLQDVVRKVSRHVSIGRAYMKSKETNNYFGLCKDDGV